MPGIDDAVLRRRQLDLDKRTADLQKYFERLARVKMAGMSSEWQIIEGRLKRQIQQLYRDMGAIQDPAKLKAFKGKTERLEAYVSQIQADLARHLPSQQAYATGILKHHFEKSYYMNAWALEQAGQIAATVPTLTPAEVLGVLVNPWLPDGATYSDRIRANTALLARDMKTIVQRAVEDGLGWNETARMIGAKTGEGYFRAVRLARTELVRAQALGASYCYMQNQDVLEGKRWNAVLDGKTAPKDADNDGKLYDLDYDTPEQPGAPGQRIPNHPNCRCIWSPTLSALGVSDKERIARDQDGNRIYTKARTYRDYAKEKGLPDLDDRLANDSLKGYLRPGETVTDLNKTVKHWTYKGQTIQVPTANWVQSPQSIPPIVPTVKKPRQPNKKAAVTAPSPAPVAPQRPAIVQKLTDVVGKYFKNDTLTDHRKIAREMLDTVGLNHVPEHLTRLSSRGECEYASTTRPSGKIRIAKYSLQSNDPREDVYKVKTVFHELYHATADGIEHDFSITLPGWDFNAWVDIEETYTESAAHYLLREAGITKKIHTSYPGKLIRNLPRLKKLNDFKNCQTIEDFGEIVVKYRMVDKKASYWRYIKGDMETFNQGWDLAEYARKNYVRYIRDNIEDLVDKVLENAPESKPARSFILNDARTVWDVIQNGGPAPAMGNELWVFENVLAAAMHEMGVM